MKTRLFSDPSMFCWQIELTGTNRTILWQVSEETTRRPPTNDTDSNKNEKKREQLSFIKCKASLDESTIPASFRIILAQDER